MRWSLWFKHGMCVGLLWTCCSHVPPGCLHGNFWFLFKEYYLPNSTWYPSVLHMPTNMDFQLHSSYKIREKTDTLQLLLRMPMCNSGTWRRQEIEYNPDSTSSETWYQEICHLDSISDIDSQSDSWDILEKHIGKNFHNIGSHVRNLTSAMILRGSCVSPNKW